MYKKENPMSKKPDTFYFDNFVACTEQACKAAALLDETMRHFDAAALEQRLEEMHQVEHGADEKKHEILNVLAKAFITPIDREDILLLSQCIDDVVDKLEDVLLRIYCNHVQSIRPEALEVMEVVVRCCGEVQRMVREFPNFRRSKTLGEYIIHINSMEEEADRLFIKNLRALHTTCQDPLEIISWREIYIYLEHCADACEDVADVIESVVIKNT